VLPLVPLQQRLEARVVAEGGPDGIDPKQGRRDQAWDGEQVFELLYRSVVLADHRIDLGERTHETGSRDGIPRDR
jgi:hypothetical protein